MYSNCVYLMETMFSFHGSNLFTSIVNHHITSTIGNSPYLLPLLWQSTKCKDKVSTLLESTFTNRHSLMVNCMLHFHVVGLHLPSNALSILATCLIRLQTLYSKKSYFNKVNFSLPYLKQYLLTIFAPWLRFKICLALKGLNDILTAWLTVYVNEVGLICATVPSSWSSLSMSLSSLASK